MGSTARKMGNSFTYTDYLQWPDDERWEIIDGEAYNMTPAPSIRHQKISAYLTALLVEFLKGKRCQIFAAPTDVVLDERNVVQPDLLVVCSPDKITEANVQGAPDLVIEILSPWTARKDKREKKALYERFGVREYLIVYPGEELIERFVLTDGCYGASDVFGAEDSFTSAIFPELTIESAEIFDRPVG